MNPIEWVKALYETFGTPHPKASMIVVVILGALSFGLVWHFAAKQVEKTHEVIAAPKPAARTTGAASTTGAESPAITGDDNQVTYGQAAHPSVKREKGRKK